MGLAWCKVSSLTAAVGRVLKDSPFPATRGRLLKLTAGKNVEGWELNYFLSKVLRRTRYADLRSVIEELDDWLEAQG
jgi:hypothetical protein